jgi:hypothetical protein
MRQPHRRARQPAAGLAAAFFCRRIRVLDESMQDRQCDLRYINIISSSSGEPALATKDR